MPMNRPDSPTDLPLPAREADVTLLQHGTLPPQSRQPSRALPELPDIAPPTPRMQPLATGARVSLPAVQDSSVLNPSPHLNRDPAPLERRPIMPSSGVNTASTLAGQHQTISPPGLLKPVRAPENSTRPPIGVQKEASDLIQTFEAGPDDAHPGMPFPAAPQKTIPPGSGMTFPPPGKILRHGPPGQAKAPLRPVSPASPPPHPAPATAVQASLVPSVLPLHTEHVVALVLEHRRRLHALDTWARGLEVAAVLSGVGALFELVVGGLPIAGGLALGAVALAAQATTLRHVAHTSAQVSALLDALSGTHDSRSR